MNPLEQLIDAMMIHEKGNPKHIQHFLKVYEFAHIIAIREQVETSIQEIVETAAIVHDIGINTSIEKYGSSAGHYQEIEGAPLAIQMMQKLAYKEDFIARVAYLVGHHHSYSNIDGLDYQILVEADFLVNIYEENYQKAQIETVLRTIFKTKTGREICQTMYL